MEDKSEVVAYLQNLNSEARGIEKSIFEILKQMHVTSNFPLNTLN